MSLLSRTSLRAACRPSITSARTLSRQLTPRPRYASSDGPKPPSQSSVKSNRNSLILAAVLIAAGAGVWYYESSNTDSVFPTSKDEFSVAIGSGSKRRSVTFERKTPEQQEHMLTVNEKSTAPARLGNPVVRWDTNVVASNEPCEDRNATDLIPRSTKGAEGSRDLVIISMIDGHAGDQTSQLLSKTLNPTVALGLAALEAGIVPGQTWYGKLVDTLTWAKTWSPPNVSKSIESSFLQLDDHICNNPVRDLAKVVGSNDSEALEAFAAAALPAAAGAVVGTVVVDVEGQGIYTAVTGDVRGVAGYQAEDGSWRCDTLSEDQMGDNPKEVARMRAEHPRSEADTVIRNGRVQGGLQPTRAFGDAVYKWTTEQGDAINEVLKSTDNKPRGIRPWNYTPPYVTARPEVTYRPLKTRDGEKLKFIVLATDGLWDCITSEEATLLVAGYLAHAKREDISKTELAKQIPVKRTEPAPYPVQTMPGVAKRGDGVWVFEGDQNAATHLIRNAQGLGDRKRRGELLSLHGKVARWFRDDTSTTVVFFD